MNTPSSPSSTLPKTCEMAAYYNEFDPFAAHWLRNLITAGHIAPGDVDERSITEVKPDDLKGYTQCHFFAGIGGWSYALRCAMWADDRPVWTGSPPCQPYSLIGKQEGNEDERNLWPHLYRLISKLRPPIFFGEQVTAAIRHCWLDTVGSNLEQAGYAFASAVLPACADRNRFHRRDRLFFVGDSRSERLEGYARDGESGQKPERLEAKADGSVGEADPVDWVLCGDNKLRPVKPGIQLLADGVSNRVGKLRGYGNAIVPQVAAEFIKAAM